ncbi:ATP-dependent RNA helicase supv3l1, mitochondrial [Chytridiales sp. JEL 0842]|nr:ATP-dependent RNA helicase supv3l1, mitochondrial [Chytridiales sp. JEL 0842]
MMKSRGMLPRMASMQCLSLLASSILLDASSKRSASILCIRQLVNVNVNNNHNRQSIRSKHHYRPWDRHEKSGREEDRDVKQSVAAKDGYESWKASNRTSSPIEDDDVDDSFDRRQDRKKIASKRKEMEQMIYDKKEHELKVFVTYEFAKSKFVRQKFLRLGIPKHVVVAELDNFAADLKADNIPGASWKELVNVFDPECRMERILLPHVYKYISSKVSNENNNIDTLMRFSDLRTPAEWYPEARLMKRRIIMHVGPTNSGKTYRALQRLEQASSGLYAGPLRLLAHEVYDRMNEKGVPFNLLTGEERRESDGVEKWAATVEMSPLNKKLAVAVIDEIQMINDDQRGWAWTQALLGLQAEEIHLCGEETALPLIQRICESTGETVEVNRYERLTKLEVEQRGLDQNVKFLRKGDCYIAFSRKRIFEARKMIETKTGLKCAVIYGSLPPETRAEQAKLFNDPESGYDILVASDAVGMGLNLNIRRIVFETVTKFNGTSMTRLTTSQLKQIAGRAGRFKTLYETGLVSTFCDKDLNVVRSAVAVQSPEPLRSAGLYPTLEQLEKFSTELPNVTFGDLLDRFEELASLDGGYFLCNLETQKSLADLIEDIPLSLKDRYILVASPTKPEDEVMKKVFVDFAKAISAGEENFLTKKVVLPLAPPLNSEKLKNLELQHKIIMLYIWLSYRFPTTFVEVEEASYMKQLAEDLINRSLNAQHSSKTAKKAKVGISNKKKRERAAIDARLKEIGYDDIKPPKYFDLQ